MEIIDYNNIYEKEFKNLLMELQKYIVKLDKEEYNKIGKDFIRNYFNTIIENVNKYEGKIFLVRENKKIIGAIVGVINNDTIDTENFKVKKRGRILDFIINKNYQGKGIGKKLLNHMENYFKTVKCEGIILDVFSNNVAYSFYKKEGYFDRTIQMMKKI